MVGLEEQFNAVDGCHSLAELRRVVQTYIEDCGFAAFVIADLTDPWNEKSSLYVHVREEMARYVHP